MQIDCGLNVSIEKIKEKRDGLTYNDYKIKNLNSEKTNE